MTLIAEVHIDAEKWQINNQEPVFHQEENWLKSAYLQLAIEYPKFYKMDVLSKMAFICVEQLKKTGPENWFLSESIPQILANKNASLFTDLQFISSYQGGKSPSPSLFVYTLPNIVTGELAIRNKWFGPNWFFILEELDWTFLTEQISLNLYDYSGYVICGWTDIKDELSSATATFRLMKL